MNNKRSQAASAIEIHCAMKEGLVTGGDAEFEACQWVTRRFVGLTIPMTPQHLAVLDDSFSLETVRLTK